MLRRLSNIARNCHHISFNEPIMKVMPSILDLEVELFDYKKFKKVRNVGSGWLWRNNFIMTCHHCVSHQNGILLKIYATFHDGRTMEVKLRYEDEEFDIALLELEKQVNYPIAKYAIQNVAEVGDTVLMIGRGTRYPHSALVGMLSHKALNDYPKEICSIYEYFTTVDCTIPRGMSGGLLTDQHGVAMGMIQRGADPIGFAIPLGIALNNLARSIKNGEAFNTPKLEWRMKSFFKGLINKFSIWR